MKTGVVEQGGDYFWVVKDNQPTLRADIALLFAEPPWGEELAAAEECGAARRPLGRAYPVDLHRPQ